ncbi:DUF4350 domain-containing protein [Actinoplanes sp. NPDC051861]|uniref:DUF4350 domain-containing protein n=1 Tax=Actinoplanes sp. NPDC051861 TaxID=3155170 RepID=UPI00343CF969
MRSRRMRATLPFLVLAGVLGFTLTVHALQQADPGDPAFLAPGSRADIGGSRVAEALRDRGVQVSVLTSTGDAVSALRDGSAPATVFIPAPEFAHLPTLTEAAGIPAGTRLVLVAPDQDILDSRGWPGEVARTRWAAGVTDSACTEVVAGRAAVLRRVYADDGALICYSGGVMRFQRDGYAVTLAGAADPFRNDRVGEYSNLDLAVGLLGGNSRVIWLDLHSVEEPPAPSFEPEPEPTFGPEAEATASPYPWSTGYPGVPGEPGEPGETGAPTPGEQEGDGQSLQDSPLAQAFPPAFWATAILIVLAAIAFAAAAARRLGTPVPEPLPSRIPAHETMLGHGRLYARARARGRSLAILREAARTRITAHLNLPHDAPADRIAAYAGLPAAHVHDVLDGGDPPRTDEELVAAARAVQDLIRRFEGDNP